MPYRKTVESLDPFKPRTQRIQLNYKCLSPKHLEFHKQWRVDTRVVVGAPGTGKTRMMAFEVIDHLWANPMFQGKKAIVAGVTGGHLREQLLPEFLKVLENKRKGQHVGAIKGQNYRISLAPVQKIELFLSDGRVSTILFLSTESKDNLRGHNASIVAADDLGPNDEEAWNVLLARAGRESEDSVDKASMKIMTLNPGTPSHWAYKRYIEIYQTTGAHHPYTWVEILSMYDNPTLKHMWAAKEAENAYSRVATERNIHGRFCGADGLVYSNFDRQKHVMVKPGNKFLTRTDLDFIRDSQIYCGIDFGGKENTACVWVAKYLDKFYVYREYFNTSPTATISKHAAYIKSHPEHVIRYYSDHYTETVNTYREHGLNLTLADKGAGSIDAGIRLVDQLLYENRLFVVDECKNVIREFESYEMGTNDKPKDKNNHCFAPGTLVRTLSGERSIESIAEGDLVLTRQGYRPVVKVFPVRDALRYELKLSNGTIIKGTGLHGIFTADGRKVNLKDLTTDDEVLCIQSKRLTEKSTVYTQGNDIIPEDLSDCTGLYGNTLTDLSLPGIISTIKTAILRTMRLGTWNVYGLVTIGRNILMKPQLECRRLSISRTLIKSVTLLKYGTGPKKVANGIPNMVKMLSPAVSLLNVNAKNVVQSIPPSNTLTLDSALTHVNQSTAVNRVSITSYGDVLDAEPISVLTDIQKPSVVPVRVESVTLIDYGPVHNLMVSGPHEYVANGIVVSNCMDALRYCLYAIAGHAKSELFVYSSASDKVRERNAPPGLQPISFAPTGPRPIATGKCVGMRIDGTLVYESE